MIADVEKIELTGKRLHKPRISAEAIEETIGVSCYAAPAKDWDIRKSALKSGTLTLNGKSACPFAVEMFQKHLSAQVHARPFFLREIGKNGEANGSSRRVRVGHLVRPSSSDSKNSR
jgi:hypothetical protein